MKSSFPWPVQRGDRTHLDKPVCHVRYAQNPMALWVPFPVAFSGAIGIFWKMCVSSQNEKHCMHQSTARILTTHVGSLPRLPALAELLLRQAQGEPVAADELARHSNAAGRSTYKRIRRAQTRHPTGCRRPTAQFAWPCVSTGRRRPRPVSLTPCGAKSRN